MTPEKQDEPSTPGVLCQALLTCGVVTWYRVLPICTPGATSTGGPCPTDTLGAAATAPPTMVVVAPTGACGNTACGTPCACWFCTTAPPIPLEAMSHAGIASPPTCCCTCTCESSTPRERQKTMPFLSTKSCRNEGSGRGVFNCCCRPDPTKKPPPRP
jgi:hypothetical protein